MKLKTELNWFLVTVVTNYEPYLLWWGIISGVARIIQQNGEGGERMGEVKQRINYSRNWTKIQVM